MRTVFVAGHAGMVGSAIVRRLRSQAINLVTRPRTELDLTDQSAVRRFFDTNSIDEVYLAAAKVGGILANQELPAAFIFENLSIASNVIDAAYRSGVQKLLFLGSSCIYPKFASQPITEPSLLSGYLEPTNEPYAVAKIAGIKLCQAYNNQYGTDFRAVMPTNLYGINDNFHPDLSHVVPALIQRIHEARARKSPSVKLWGSGSTRCEVLHVDDHAPAG